jgi:hypothetical protein
MRDQARNGSWRQYPSIGDINEYADETGGLAWHTKRAWSAEKEKNDVETALANLIDHLRARYSVAYVPSNMNRDGRFRRIQLKISPEVERREGELVVLTRRGYYGPRKEDPNEIR